MTFNITNNTMYGRNEKPRRVQPGDIVTIIYCMLRNGISTV